MFANPRREFIKAHPRRCAATCFLTFLALGVLIAGAAAWAGPVKISFLPPPMEGTLSLGVYDHTGSLVRVLKREADVEDFTQADDALQTEWDGKGDAGNVLPAGTYRARGVAVGDLGVSGEEYLGNDWVTEENSPHLKRIISLVVDARGKLFIGAEGPLLSQALAWYAVTLTPASNPGDELEVTLQADVPPPTPTGVPLFSTKGPVSAMAAGPGGTVWSIPDGKNIVQKSQDGTVLRTLKTDVSESAPSAVAASTTEEKLYVLYENAAMQRLRGYDFTGVKPGGAPRVIFQKDITFTGTYEQVAPLLKFPDGKPFVALPVFNAKLVRNPLYHDKPGSLALKAFVDKEGAWLATADGLPLCKVSDTPGLRWAALGAPGPKKPLMFFTSDGAVVERYQISAIAKMMAFDAGSYPWAPPAPLPSPASAQAQPGAVPAPSPVVSPAPSATAWP